MHWIAVVALALAATTRSGIAPIAPITPMPPVTPDSAIAPLVAGQNRFAFALYAQLAPQSGNLFVSPFSVHAAMSLAATGAHGATETAMTRALRLPAPPVASAARWRALLADLNAGGGSGENRSELAIANAVFTGQRFALLPAFVEGAKRDFGGEARSVDFANAAEASGAINGWVAERTHDRIRDLVPPSALNAQTASVLVNAIWFHGRWRSPFLASATRTEPFHRGAAGDVTAPMMSKTLRASYAEDAQSQVLRLPYADGRLEMVVMLPKRASGLAAMERALSAPALNAALERATTREVRLSLPRFTFTRATRMDAPLRALGMASAFDPAKGDFSNMTSARPTAITAVFHKAFVSVDESGTEAAAATGAVMEVTAMPVIERPVVFRADHPFVFLIRDGNTGAILFVGRVADPS